jgi:DNA polymerase IIIc chi subunit
MSRKTFQALPCLQACPVAMSPSLAMMAISKRPIVISVADRTQNTMLRVLLWSCWETSHLCHHSRSDHCKWWCDRHVSLAVEQCTG